nr:uncharacterized protein LOC100185247 isoform X2 [Ciona intestinalis]|eukprot:XP_018670618.1 uncharacterized protein LOC100185247 isoform X2 [Ciona intestinalis]
MLLYVLLLSVLVQAVNCQTGTTAATVIGDDAYPIFHVEYRFRRNNSKCTCPENDGIEWSAWSRCETTSSFTCHKGIRVQSKPCTLRNNDCQAFKYKFCYDEGSCTGEWVLWNNPSYEAPCSRPCGSGVRVRVKLCTSGERIGLFCVSTERKPYKLEYEACNQRPCLRGELLNSSTLFPWVNRSWNNSDNFTMPLSTRLQEAPQHSILTWILAGATGVLALCLIVCLIVCVRTMRANNKASQCALPNQPTNTKVPENYQRLSHEKGGDTAVYKAGGLQRTEQIVGGSYPALNHQGTDNIPLPPPVLTHSFTDIPDSSETSKHRNPKRQSEEDMGYIPETKLIKQHKQKKKGNPLPPPPLDLVEVKYDAYLEPTTNDSPTPDVPRVMISRPDETRDPMSDLHSDVNNSHIYSEI